MMESDLTSELDSDSHKAESYSDGSDDSFTDLSQNSESSCYYGTHSESYSDGSDDSFTDSSQNSESSCYYGTHSESSSSDSESLESSSTCSTRSSSDNSDDTHSHSSESSNFSSCSTAEESDPENSQVPGSGVDPSLQIPLYSGSRLTVLESCLLLLQLLLRSVLIACHCIDYRV